MGESQPPEALKELDDRLRLACEREAADRDWRQKGGDTPNGALGLALRVGVEMVVSLAIGVGIGWSLDAWLGTRPWLMLVFIVLGGAAGILNVYRMARGMAIQDGEKGER